MLSLHNKSGHYYYAMKALAPYNRSKQKTMGDAYTPNLLVPEMMSLIMSYSSGLLVPEIMSLIILYHMKYIRSFFNSNCSIHNQNRVLPKPFEL